MRYVLVALSLVLGLAACKKGETMDPLVKEAMGKLTEARDKGCACANLECMTKVQNEFGKWYLDNSERLQALTTKATKAQNAAADKLTAELDACAKKLEQAGNSASP